MFFTVVGNSSGARKMCNIVFANMGRGVTDLKDSRALRLLPPLSSPSSVNIDDNDVPLPRHTASG